METEEAKSLSIEGWWW